jgi:hypothetical protein
VGDSLKPKITAVIHPANSGAGIPDGGLFSAKELKKHGHADDKTLFGKLKPERGVIEVKPLDTDLAAFEATPQVRDYLEHYGQILLTNYRSFALWSWRNGKAERGETHTLAPSETEFWTRVQAIRNDPHHPELERLWQFLRRALLSTARIATPQDLAPPPRPFFAFPGPVFALQCPFSVAQGGFVVLQKGFVAWQNRSAPSQDHVVA